MTNSESKAILFLNGIQPQRFPDTKDYDGVYCSDGAYEHVRASQIKVDEVIGDFDSLDESLMDKGISFVHRADQDYTDFEKSLQFLVEKGHETIDVYGASGGEQDHFMGNLSVALKFKNRLNLKFFDDQQSYFFADKSLELPQVQGKMISLVPIFHASKVWTEGLEYALNVEDLQFGTRIGTRNRALSDRVQIKYEEGDLLIFIEN